MTEPTDRPGPSGSDRGAETPPGEGAGTDPGFTLDGPRVGEALMGLRIVTGALAASLVVYAAVGWFVTRRAGFEAAGLGAPIIAVLVSMAVLDLLLAPAIERALLGGVRSDSPGGHDLERVLGEYGKAKFVGFAFREAAAVLGLLVTLFTGDVRWCFVLAAATLVAMALAWPSRTDLGRAVGGTVLPG